MTVPALLSTLLRRSSSTRFITVSCSSCLTFPGTQKPGSTLSENVARVPSPSDSKVQPPRINDRPAALGVELDHLAALQRTLPLGQLLITRQLVKAGLRRGGDRGLELSVIASHQRVFSPDPRV